jgi:hypothetical protein
MARLDRAADLVGADHRTLLSQVRTPAGDARRASANLEWLLDRLDEV